MSRSACVTQITAVRLTKMTRNAPNVVRKIYRLIDPIRRVVPQVPTCPAIRPAPAPDAKRNQPNPNPRQVYLDPSTKWPCKGKAVEHAQQKVKTAAAIRAPSTRLLQVNRAANAAIARNGSPHAVKSLEIGRFGALQRGVRRAIWRSNVPACGITP